MAHASAWCAVLAGVFRNGDHAPQLPDILLHHTAQIFRPILFPDAVLQLPDQARRLCRPVMENLMVRDLVRRHPDVVRLHDDPVPGEYTPDQPGRRPASRSGCRPVTNTVSSPVSSRTRSAVARRPSSQALSGMT